MSKPRLWEISFLMLSAAVLAACGGSVSTTALGDADGSTSLLTLDNTEWVLTLLNGHSPMDGPTITLSFYPGNYMEGITGCNSYGVDYATDGSAFRVPEIHRTEEECEVPDRTMQQEAAYFEALASVAAYRATEERLEFDDAAGTLTLVFGRQLPPTVDRDLQDTEWMLTKLRGQDLLAGSRITLNLAQEGFEGFAGCNNYGGEYMAADAGNWMTSSIWLTAQNCGQPALMDQEQAFVAALGDTASYWLVADRLELQDATGETVLVYTRRADCAEEPADLAGTAWQLVSVGDREPAKSSATLLAFLDDRWLVEYSECEGYISSYQATGHDLSTDFSAWLGRVCPDDRGHSVISLEVPDDYCLAQGRLQITTMPGRVFAYEPLPEAAQLSLEKPTWSLLSIVGARQIEGEAVPWPDPGGVVEGTEITIAFKDNTASGSAGCNDYGAAYTLDGMLLAFSDVVAIDRDCPTPEGVMEQEQRYLGTLRDVTNYHIYGALLWLWTKDGRAMVFTAPEAK